MLKQQPGIPKILELEDITFNKEEFIVRLPTWYLKQYENIFMHYGY